jgi:ketosteroid isomerase-like protein
LDRDRHEEDSVPTEHDVATVRRLYIAVAENDQAGIAECFSHDAVWHLPGSNPLSGTHRGWESIMKNLFAKQGPLSGGSFRTRLLDLAVGDRYVVAIAHATAEHAGQRLDQTVCQLMRVENGKIIEVRGHYGDEAALDRFWNGDVSSDG